MKHTKLHQTKHILPLPPFIQMQDENRVVINWTSYPYKSCHENQSNYIHSFKECQQNMRIYSLYILEIMEFTIGNLFSERN